MSSDMFISARQHFASSSSQIFCSTAFLFASHSALTSCEVHHVSFIRAGWTLHPLQSRRGLQVATSVGLCLPAALVCSAGRWLCQCHSSFHIWKLVDCQMHQLV